MRKRQRFLLIVVPILLLLSVLSGFYIYVLHGLPSVRDVDAGLALPSTRIFDRHMRLLYEITPNGVGRNTVLPLDQIPQHCVNALVATEDAAFYEHVGVSVRGVARALWINVRGGDVLAGGSTITQQVARNLLLDPRARAERTLRRKLREMALAVQLERAYTKDDILALWLNQTDFGNLAFGIDAAARAYFGKDAATLSLAECALLVGLPQSPARYDPLTNPDAAKERQDTVLRLMTENGFITTAEADAARRDALQYASVPYPIQAPHAVLEVWKQLEERYPDALYSTGLDVVTTIDLDWHTTAERIIRRQLDLLNNPPNEIRPPANANNAALVAMDPNTGEIRVMIGSPNYFDERISGAVNLAVTPRQPGSTLKPFTYALTLDPTRSAPWTAATMMMDVRTPFVTRRLESYVPANFDLKEHGPVSVREALGSSFNIPAVLALESVGVDSLIGLMNELGVTELARNPDVDLAVTLGGGEVRLVNLTAAYAALVTGGRRVQPTLIQSVTTADGTVLYTHQPRPGAQIIDSRVAFIITDILSDDSARMPGFGRNSALNIGRPAAAKTGTTTDLRDNWVIGYTPDLVTGVWVGNANYTPMIDATGLSGTGPIWNQFMREVLKDVPESEFAWPDGLVTVDVCALSGMLPTDACTVTRREWFIDGTVPTEYDTMHQVFTIDTLTGALADDTTPADRRAEQVFVILPPEARAWGAKNGIPEPPGYRVTDNETRLRMLSPDAYTTYEISLTLPPESQRLQLLAATPQDTIRVTYRLNGDVVAEAMTAPFDAWWQLAVGDYVLETTITRLDGTELTLEPVPFRVQPYQPPQSFDMP